MAQEINPSDTHFATDEIPQDHAAVVVNPVSDEPVKKPIDMHDDFGAPPHAADPMDEPFVDLEPIPVNPAVAALEAPAHEVGYSIDVEDMGGVEDHLFRCAVDKQARLWRIEEGENGVKLTFVGRLSV